MIEEQFLAVGPRSEHHSSNVHHDHLLLQVSHHKRIAPWHHLALSPTLSGSGNYMRQNLREVSCRMYNST